MNIAFSTEWFLTIPGMLITCGVILLLIALIMFIVSLSKGKKKNQVSNVEVPVDVQPEPVVNQQPVINNEPVINPVVQNTNDVAVAEPMGSIEEVNNVIPVIPEISVVDNQVVEPVVPTVDIVIPEVPVIDEVVPAVEIPVVEPVVPVEVQEEQVNTVPVIPTFDEIIPIPEVVPTETIPEVSEVNVDNTNETDLGTTNVNIYGGAIPIVEVKPQEESRVIYGGADPLEATQNLPKIDVHHEPYSGGNTPVTPVIPDPIPEVVIPEVSSVPTEIPVVNEDVKQVTIPTPAVIEIPDVEQL